MVKYIDWLLVKGYFKAYFVCLISLLSLYIVIDLFNNLDDFTRKLNPPAVNGTQPLEEHVNKKVGFLQVLQVIAQYYGYHSAQIFDQLCEPIVLLAAMFTVAWMQRNNELMPLLSAGVSTRRVVLPVLLSAWVMLTLAVLNGELIIPRIASRLLLERSDPDGNKEMEVRGMFDSNGVEIDAGPRGRAFRQRMVVKPFIVEIPLGVGRDMALLMAQEAYYIPPNAEGEHRGGWLMTGVQPAGLDDKDFASVLYVYPKEEGKYFLYTKEVDFDALTRHPKWFQKASTRRLYQELQRPDSIRVPQLAVVFHMRLTRPLLGMILVLMGLSIILTDQNRNVFISSGMCLVLCGLFFAVIFASKQLGDYDMVGPALAAWLPVLLFGPLALGMFDAVHT